MLAAVPMCHSYGVENALMGPLWGGASIRCVEGFVTTQVLELVIGGGVTVLPGVPFHVPRADRVGGTGRGPRPALRLRGGFGPPPPHRRRVHGLLRHSRA